MKKLVCLLLAVIMMASVCSVVALAEADRLDPSSIVIDGIKDEAYKESQKLDSSYWYAFSNNTAVWDAYDPDRIQHTMYYTWDDDFVYLYFVRTSKFDKIYQPKEGETIEYVRDMIELADCISVYVDTAPSAPINQATANNGEPSSGFDRNCISGADPYHRLQARAWPQFDFWNNYFRTDEGMFLTKEQFAERRGGESGYEDLDAMYLKENGACEAATFIDYETNTMGFEMKYARKAGETGFRVGASTSAREIDWDEVDPSLDWGIEIAYTVANGPAWWMNFDALVTINYADYDPTEPDAADPQVAVMEAIDALPAAADVTLDDEAAITDARKAYNLLTADQKAAVTNVDKLNACEARLADLKAVDQVDKVIAALPAADAITLDNAGAVKAARQLFNALTDAQKAMVKDVAKLEAAEAKIDELSGMPGDVNGDKKVNASDALMTLKAAVGKITLTEAQTKAADVTKDGKVNASDALLILKMAVGKA